MIVGIIGPTVNVPTVWVDDPMPNSRYESYTITDGHPKKWVYITGGKIREVSAKQAAIESIRSQPFF